ncbi:ArsR/SmtB family transcription factor [Clostridium sp. Marseille-Q7071]
MVNKRDDKHLNQHILSNLSELFWVLSDATRIRILYALSEKEMCVCELAKLLNNKQSSISHKLRILRNSKLVGFKKKGKRNIYFLNNLYAIEIINKAIEFRRN